MVNKNTFIKERIKQIAKIQGVTYKKIFDIIGMTDGGFKGNNIKRPINSDAIVKLYTEFPDIDLTWLITGKEEKCTIQEEKVLNVVSEDAENYGNKYKDLYIKSLEKINELNEKLEKLNVELKALQFAKLNEIEKSILKELDELSDVKTSK